MDDLQKDVLRRVEKEMNLAFAALDVAKAFNKPKRSGRTKAERNAAKAMRASRKGCSRKAAGAIAAASKAMRDGFKTYAKKSADKRHENPVWEKAYNAADWTLPDGTVTCTKEQFEAVQRMAEVEQRTYWATGRTSGMFYTPTQEEREQWSADHNGAKDEYKPFSETFCQKFPQIITR